MSNQESQTFVEHIQRAAARDPDRVIYTVLDDGERAGETLTNGELTAARARSGRPSRRACGRATAS